MTLKLLLTVLGLGGLSLALADRQAAEPRRFEQPAATTLARLQTGRRVIDGTGMGSLTLTATGTNSDTLLIHVSRAGDSHGAQCRVTVTPVSATQSKAAVDCTQSSGKDEPMHQLGIKMLDLIVGEHVGATVDARRYDINMVSDRIVGLLIMNRATVAASINAGNAASP